MKDQIRRWTIALSAALIVGYVAFAAHGKESIRRDGKLIFLPLAPVDPRSLMQGDYMELRYEFSQRSADIPPRGVFVLGTDQRNVARVTRVAQEPTKLLPGEVCLRYFKHDDEPKVGAESFFFQEGKGQAFAKARFAAVRVASNCDKLLIELRDVDLKPIR